MSMKKVLVTGVEDTLGSKIAETLATRADLEVVGVAAATNPAIDGVEAVDQPRGYAGIAQLLRGRAFDTIILAHRPWSRAAVDAASTGEHVIATMQLTAAAAKRTAKVRRVVMVSSTMVYPASSRGPLLHSESEPLQPRRGSVAASLLEAEGFVRDLATANPNLSASVLRLADLAGLGTNDTLSGLLSRPAIPAIWGFDPTMQLLHLDDAVTAIAHAADHELAGVYNVASDGNVRWRRAVHLTRKPLIDLPNIASGLLTTILRWSNQLHAGDDIVDVLRFGRATATDSFGRSGFEPAWAAEHCVVAAAGGAHQIA